MSSYHSSIHLPAPDAEQIAHSSRLIEVILQAMHDAGGVLSFRDYMQLCLYAPGLGYYAAGSVKFGRDGDFVTAPELSPLFGACLANHARERFASGLESNVLEFGAGTGKLAADIIKRLTALDVSWQSYSILETSPDLRERQQAYLKAELTAEDFARVQWLDTLPQQFCGLVLGNEVLDAMPVNVLVKQGDWIELGVAFDGQRFVWQEFSRDSEAVQTMRALDADQSLANDYCTELNLNYAPWCQSLAQSCQSAELLLIDYGYERAQYYHPSRSSGTLMCFYQHRAHPDPLVFPGLQDITAFVDFDAFADAASASGLQITGLKSQAEFLMSNGLLELLQASPDDPVQQLAQAQQVKTLTLPGEMGEKFKVISLRYASEQPLA